MVALLESLGVGEKIINPLRNSSVGYYALTYALYKVASPARYAVTVGGNPQAMPQSIIQLGLFPYLL